MSDQLDIPTIAEELNTRAAGHAIGELQAIRTKLKGFSRRPGSKIFSSQTINDDWAFHHGGRSELQFNIGWEESGHELRHGVAFSFEPSQTLPSIDVLIPKARLFNDYINEYPEMFADMRMWHYRNDGKAPRNLSAPAAIMPELVSLGTFVFLGKTGPVSAIDYEVILNDFDRLLSLYQYVESGGRDEAYQNRKGNGFRFHPGTTERRTYANASLSERELDINLKHNLLQAALCNCLISKYGRDKVGDEQITSFGTRIDVVVFHGEDDLWYYEIKTAWSSRSCLREAFGQLMEYAYWPGAREASRLIVCGESPLDVDGQTYLGYLRSRFNIPIDYEQVTLQSL